MQTSFSATPLLWQLSPWWYSPNPPSDTKTQSYSRTSNLFFLPPLIYATCSSGLHLFSYNLSAYRLNFVIGLQPWIHLHPLQNFPVQKYYQYPTWHSWLLGSFTSCDEFIHFTGVHAKERIGKPGWLNCVYSSFKFLYSEHLVRRGLEQAINYPSTGGNGFIHSTAVHTKVHTEEWDVAHYDTDAVILKNPLSLYNTHADSDVVGSTGTFPFDLGMKWGFTLCMGTFLFRCTPQTGTIIIQVIIMLRNVGIISAEYASYKD